MVKTRVILSYHIQQSFFGVFVSTDVNPDIFLQYSLVKFSILLKALQQFYGL